MICCPVCGQRVPLAPSGRPILHTLNPQVLWMVCPIWEPAWYTSRTSAELQARGLVSSG